jgi:hypothetical protein
MMRTRYRWLVLAAAVVFLAAGLTCPPSPEPSTWSRWAILALLVVVGGLAGTGEQPPRPDAAASVLTLAFLTVAAVSSALGTNPPLAFAKLAALAAEMGLAVVLLPRLLRRDDWRWLWTRLAWMLAAPSAIALVLGASIRTLSGESPRIHR